jgi:hypothetical protein
VTEKKAKGRPKKAPVFPVVGDEVEEAVSEQQLPEEGAGPTGFVPAFLIPVDGPDYRITQTGDIVLFDGSPIPEDHHVHPSHRRIAAERKEASK